MKKQMRTLAVLAALVAVCLAGYFALRAWNQSREAASHTYLSRLTGVTRLSYDKEGEEISFTRDGDGNWTWDGDEDFPVDGTALEEAAGLLSALEAVRTIDQPEALSSYGLEECQRTITVQGDGDQTVTLLLGDEVDGNYYAMVQGNDTVYTVAGDLFEATDYTLMELGTVDQPPTITESTAETVVLQKGERSVTLTKDTRTETQETGEADENGDPVTEEVTVYTWYLAGQALPQESEAVDELIFCLWDLSFDGCCAFKPEESELEAMGLTGGDTLTLTVTYSKGQKLELLIGGPAADGDGTTVCAMEAGSDMVYTMDSGTAEALEGLLDADWTAVPEEG